MVELLINRMVEMSGGLEHELAPYYDTLPESELMRHYVELEEMISLGWDVQVRSFLGSVVKHSKEMWEFKGLLGANVCHWHDISFFHVHELRGYVSEMLLKEEPTLIRAYPMLLWIKEAKMLHEASNPYIPNYWRRRGHLYEMPEERLLELLCHYVALGRMRKIRKKSMADFVVQKVKEFVMHSDSRLLFLDRFKEWMKEFGYRVDGGSFNVLKDWRDGRIKRL